jgi:hypothetical protein
MGHRNGDMGDALKASDTPLSRFPLGIDDWMW